MFDSSHIHPMLVHFPIALILLGVLFSGIHLYKPNKFPYPCGEFILYFGTLAAILAAFSGSEFALDFTNPILKDAKNIHSTFAGITVFLLCATTVLYLGGRFITKYSWRFYHIGFLFYILSALSVSITGFLGGVLVYNDLLKL